MSYINLASRVIDCRFGSRDLCLKQLRLSHVSHFLFSCIENRTQDPPDNEHEIKSIIDDRIHYKCVCKIERMTGDRIGEQLLQNKV